MPVIIQGLSKQSDLVQDMICENQSSRLSFCHRACSLIIIGRRCAFRYSSCHFGSVSLRITLPTAMKQLQPRLAVRGVAFFDFVDSKLTQTSIQT